MVESCSLTKWDPRRHAEPEAPTSDIQVRISVVSPADRGVATGELSKCRKFTVPTSSCPTGRRLRGHGKVWLGEFNTMASQRCTYLYICIVPCQSAMQKSDSFFKTKCLRRNCRHRQQSKAAQFQELIPHQQTATSCISDSDDTSCTSLLPAMYTPTEHP